MPDGPTPPTMFDAAVLKPGDSVLLVTEQNLHPAELLHVQESLVKNFPGVRFVVVGGFQASVIHREDRPVLTIVEEPQ